MSRLPPVDRASAPRELDPIFAMIESAMGFLPNSLLIMARRPELVQAFAGLAAAVNLNSDLPPGLNNMIAYMCSYAAGCMYCQAHTHHSAHRAGADTEKLEAIWEYETHPSFSEAERAALRFAQAAGQTPNAVTDADFEDLRKFYSEKQILQIVAVISLFGFLNRWNDTLGTPLEAEPLAYAKETLTAKDWSAGKHDRAATTD
ncbi:MAG: fusion protein [Alphaproteobacteria bacterium HGW-Alphaproteobacteria-5]|nr:MAG: fusion protein [Alphaproteobacteria bacterium HGW-Alphaproteobacteria-5]